MPPSETEATEAETVDGIPKQELAQVLLVLGEEIQNTNLRNSEELVEAYATVREESGFDSFLQLRDVVEGT